MKKQAIFIIVIILLIIGGIIFSQTMSKDKTYKDIVYNISYPSDTLFDVKDLDTFLFKQFGDLRGHLISDVNLNEIEAKLNQYPYIRKSDVLSDLKGNLHINAEQHKVIAKVFNKKGEAFYISQSGRLVPSGQKTSGRILIANGNITQGYEKDFDLEERKDVSLYNIWELAKFIEKNSYWKAQISQIYVISQNEIRLAPTVGNHVIIFGKIDNMEEKFENLKTIYDKGFAITGWDKYKTINLTFGTQIPCEKRNF